MTDSIKHFTGFDISYRKSEGIRLKLWKWEHVDATKGKGKID